MVYAGIVYAVTGACHQASNRIMFPAQIELPAWIPGYAISEFFYGKYGVGTWPELASCTQGAHGFSANLNSSLTFAYHKDQRSTEPMTIAMDAPRQHPLP